jgi:ribosomal protein S27E
MHLQNTRAGEGVRSMYGERVRQWLESKHAVNCGQCRQSRWHYDRAELVALIPVISLPRDTSEGADLREAARGNTAIRVVCGHCGNILLIDEQVMEQLQNPAP